MVYNTIGVACHSMKYRYYRQLVDVAFTEDEVKEIAAQYDDYPTEPDDEGEVTTRPGELNDRMHSPYANDKQARSLNNGALPPDLSQIVRARDGYDDYVFALLTGYRDPPHGVTLGENMNYNLYFSGLQIAMPPPLAEGAVTFDDGTECSISQQAKDVTIYLMWSSFMEQDERHLMGIKTIATLGLFFIPLFYWKKFRWSSVKARKVEFLRRKKEE
jgi:ubiquinol-cytochrome c reductase cytochrome c1 subunit